ncbi:MAG: cupin domain-containing protein [Nitrospirales bacterium]
MNRETKAGYGLRNGEGWHVDFRGTRMTVKASGEASEGTYSLIEMLHPPNVGPALHIHPTGAEAFYVLEGKYTIRCDEEVYTANVGDFVFIPKGCTHSYHSGANGGKVLVLSPAGLENYFAEVADVLKVGTITWELEHEIAKKYGQEFLDEIKHWGQ